MRTRRRRVAHISDACHAVGKLDDEPYGTLDLAVVGKCIEGGKAAQVHEYADGLGFADTVPQQLLLVQAPAHR